MDAIKKELLTHPSMPTIIMGDFNAEPDTLNAIDELIKEEQWMDIGKHAIRWGGEDAQNICKTNPKAKPPRIDGVVANKAARSCIAGFEVEKDVYITTHSIIKLKLKRKAAREEHTYVAPLTFLKRLFQTMVRDIVADQQGTEAASIWKEQRELSHGCIDARLEKADTGFCIHRQQRDTSKY